MATLGALRWDVGGYGNLQFVDQPENDGLRNPDFHGRAPFYATVRDTNSLDIVATQATMDQEIAFALAGGINYWAFYRYRDYTSQGRVTPDPGLVLYQASTARGALKWCSIELFGSFGNSVDYADKIGRLVTEVQQAHYQMVLTDRPLIYLHYSDNGLAAYFGGSRATAKIAIDALRAAIVTAGLGTPYIVIMTDTYVGVSTLLTDLGADAASQYSGFLPATCNAAYTDLTASTIAGWDSFRGQGVKIVPTAMSGWNAAPRSARPWVSSMRPAIGKGRVVVPATDEEMATHFAAARTYVETTYPTACEAQTIITYSWNEFSEGYRALCPTRDNPTGTHLAGIAAAMA